MEKLEHARLLRRAMDDRGLRAQTVADAIGVNPRTIGNWISRSKPTMPNPEDRAALRKLLGNYEIGGGDPVEAALRQSNLLEWRQDQVIAFYKRNLHEQRAEGAG